MTATMIAPVTASQVESPKGTTGGASLFRRLVATRSALASATRKGGDIDDAALQYAAARESFLAHAPDARESLSLIIPATKAAPESRRTLPVSEAQGLIRGNVPTTVAVLFRSRIG